MIRGQVKTMALLLAVMGLLQSPALANSGRGDYSHPGHGGPPPEAIEAFRDRSDDPAEFVTSVGDRLRATYNGRMERVQYEG